MAHPRMLEATRPRIEFETGPRLFAALSVDPGRERSSAPRQKTIRVDKHLVALNLAHSGNRERRAQMDDPTVVNSQRRY
jgi:hypothetical protein